MGSDDDASLAAAPIVVVKIGSSSLVDATTHRLDELFLRTVAKQIGVLVNDFGWRVVLVMSGAVACGVYTLRLAERPEGVAERQALAAIGQVDVVSQWRAALESEANLLSAQLLLTHGDFADRARSHNLMATLRVLSRWRVVPILNENDPIATAELTVGDNDQLSAVLASQIGAQALLLLTDVDGVYDSNPNTNPNACRLAEISVLTAEVLAAAGGPGSNKGRGGMRSKLESARLAAASGVTAWIAAARAPNVILRALLPMATLRDLGVATDADEEAFATAPPVITRPATAPTVNAASGGVTCDVASTSATKDANRVVGTTVATTAGSTITAPACDGHTIGSASQSPEKVCTPPISFLFTTHAPFNAVNLVGTRIPAVRPHVKANQKWLGAQRCAGRVLLDAGAVLAVRARNNLLFVGITDVVCEQPFNAFDAVSLVDAESKFEIARALITVSSGDLLKVKGLQTTAARAVLGHAAVDVAAHRDDILLLDALLPPACSLVASVPASFDVIA
jgi:glutamate 5-kinase